MYPEGPDGQVFAARIRARCVREGGCLLFQGALANGYVPAATYKQQSVNVRRWMWEHYGNPALPDGQAVGVSCRERRCIERVHLVAERRGPKPGATWDLGARMRMAQRQQSRSPLTVTDVAEIRASTDSLDTLCERYSMSRRAIQRIRDFDTWKLMPASPFAGLGQLKQPELSA